MIQYNPEQPRRRKGGVIHKGTAGFFFPDGPDHIDPDDAASVFEYMTSQEAKCDHEWLDVTISIEGEDKLAVWCSKCKAVKPRD